MIVTIIKKLLTLKRKLYQKYYTKKVQLQCKSFKGDLTVNHYSRVTENSVLGKNVNFNGMVIKGSGSIVIGDNFHSGEGCVLISSYHKYDDGNSIPYDDKENVNKDIVIEDNVWLGDRVIVLGGVVIGEGSIIQAGSVVTESVPKYAISGGHPSKVFKCRDIDHYKKLKEERRFH